MYKKFFKNKKIIITGNTGFKGAWLTLWLLKFQAKIIGISNNIPTKPSLFKLLKLDKKIIHFNADVRNYKILKQLIIKYQPDYIFHLAGQSLVKKSYFEPLNTWQTNTLGTVNLLDSLRFLNKKCVCVIVTSDKSYRNFEINRGYVETDILGGDDPYSSSKASAELVFNSYVKSFFKKKNSKIFLSSVRAGNVIGGGDWSDNRLIPDCVRFWSNKKKALIRNPNSTRPWQHVLEAINGYLILAINLSKDKKKKIHGQSFNFGPPTKNNYSVIDLVNEIRKNWRKINWKKINSKKIKAHKYPESKLLKINSTKARKVLNWMCLLNFNKTAEFVAKWYKNYYEHSKTNIYDYSMYQILEFEKLIIKSKVNNLKNVRKF